LDLAGSWLIGNRASDIEAGRRAGCRTVLIGAGIAPAVAQEPAAVCATFAEAVDVILSAGTSG
jgi:D-glycero-D-manno-heptose 1,7-bisphosphate phosphatase